MLINSINIIGCGGHSKVVIDALRLHDKTCQISLWDNNPELLGKTVSGLFVNAPIVSFKGMSGNIHIAIGSNKIREIIIDDLPNGFILPSIIHPRSYVSSSARVGSGTFIAARAILAPESSVGLGCIINHGAIADHDVKVGDFCHLAPNCTIGGNVTIGKGVLIGSGSTILPGLTIGDYAIVGSGAVVVNDVMSNTTVKGVPAS